MLEKCDIHGLSRNRPCVSTDIASRLSHKTGRKLNVNSLFIVIPQKKLPHTIKECYLIDDDYQLTLAHLANSRHSKGRFLGGKLVEWIDSKKSAGYNFLIDRDYVNEESNDGLFIRSNKHRIKFVCPFCLHEYLDKNGYKRLLLPA